MNNRANMPLEKRRCTHFELRAALSVPPLDARETPMAPSTEPPGSGPWSADEDVVGVLRINLWVSEDARSPEHVPIRA
ncbi:unnamed protein product [Caenorhabditis auriculariae]|uniref:Uncharacterized protein n=1 Tax=Caenorhabditis auriculariae TaxID=2777116 RepID=A0A8S1HRP3_9PELO|nr:unnamed protein product [Caenorhabditis auriculariae]